MLITDTEAPNLYKKILFTGEDVEQGVRNIATQLVDKYNRQNPLFVCLLRGAVPFSVELMSAIARQDPHFHPEMDYMTISTRGDSRTASEPVLKLDIDKERTVVTGRPVVVLDDMLDEGLTARFAHDHLIELGASNVDLAVMVERVQEREAYGSAEFAAFRFEGKEWLTGMGLDDTRVGHEGNRFAGWIAIAHDLPGQDQV
jgi:hypoxanthine phosphoribosyltransferase